MCAVWADASCVLLVHLSAQSLFSMAIYSVHSQHTMEALVKGTKPNLIPEHTQWHEKYVYMKMTGCPWLLVRGCKRGKCEWNKHRETFSSSFIHKTSFLCFSISFFISSFLTVTCLNFGNIQPRILIKLICSMDYWHADWPITAPHWADCCSGLFYRSALIPTYNLNVNDFIYFRVDPVEFSVVMNPCLSLCHI